ncbi:MAG: hypothetical protein ABR538_14310 [Candidatus Binatia bacterium]
MGASSTTPPTSSSVMRLLRSIVAVGPEAPSSPKPNAVLRFLQSQNAGEADTAGVVRDPEGHRDPAREAAMNYIRRLRIHAA